MNASNNDYITLLYTGDIQQSRLCNQISGNRFFLATDVTNVP